MRQKRRSIKDRILELSHLGKNYSEICTILNCSKGSVCYHLGKGQKEKTRNRTKKCRSLQHPFTIKIETFEQRYKKELKQKIKQATTFNRTIYYALKQFFKNIKTKEYLKMNITIEQVLNKIGQSPKCYLTGRIIDINMPKSYAFDHMIPVSRGGTNTIDNLGLSTKLVNRSKTDMTPEEFLEMCLDVVKNFGYKVSK